MSEGKTKTCPFCGEEVKFEAQKCKHCKELIGDKACPFCGEIVKVAATKCKHCKSELIKSSLISSPKATSDSNRLGFAITALVLGILTFILRIGLRELALENQLTEVEAFWGLMQVGFFILLSLVFGIISLAQKRGGKGLSIAGIILAIISIL